MKRANAVLKGLLPEGAPIGKIKKACLEEGLDVLLQALVADRKVKVPLDEETGEPTGEGEPVFDAKRAAYEVKVIRMYASALGVQPSPDKLKQHRDLALRQHNYELLERILALSNESAAGMAADLALSALKEFGPQDRRYQKLKESFGEITFTPHQVNCLYLDLIESWAESQERHIDADYLNDIKAETGVPVAHDAMQSAYVTMMSAQMPTRCLKAFQEVTDEKLEFTPQIVHELEQLAATNPSLLAEYDEVLQFCEDKRVAERLHRAALGAGHLDHALSIADEAGIAFDAEMMRAHYQRLVDLEKPLEAVQLSKRTKVPFGPTLLQSVYKSLYKTGNFRILLGLQKEVNVAPQFGAEAPKMELPRGDLAEAEALAALDIIEAAKLSKAASAAAIGDIYVLTSPTNASTIDKRVDKLCEARTLELPAPIQSARATHIIAGALARIDKAERDCRSEHNPDLSPLLPHNRCNIGKYQEYGRIVRDTVDTTVQRISALKAAMLERSQIESLYDRCIDLALVQCARGDDCLSFAQVQKVTGFPVQDVKFFTALSTYAIRPEFDGKKNSQLIQTFRDKTGLYFPMTVHARSQIGRNLVDQAARHHRNHISTTWLPGQLEWLAVLDGEKGFNQAFQEDVSNLAVSQMSTCPDDTEPCMVAFDGLAPFAGTNLWTPARVERIRERVSSAVKEGRWFEFTEKQKRVPFELVGREKLTELAQQYLLQGFSSDDYRKYDALMNELPYVALDFDVVRNSVVEELSNQPTSYTRVVDVERRLGRPIIATPQEYERIKDSVLDNDDYALNLRQVASALGVDFGPFKQELVKDHLTYLMGPQDASRVAAYREQFQDWGVELFGSAGAGRKADAYLEEILDGVYDGDFGEEAHIIGLRFLSNIAQLSDKSKPGYAAPRHCLDKLFKMCQEKGAYRDVHQLMQSEKKAPPRDVQDKIVDETIARGVEFDAAGNIFCAGRDVVAHELVASHNYVLSPVQQGHIMKRTFAYGVNALASLEISGARFQGYNAVFKFPIALDEERQSQYYQKVQEALGQRLQNKKGYFKFGSIVTAAKVAPLITSETIRADAVAKSAAYFVDESTEGSKNFFRGLALAYMTGVRPALKPEQYDICKRQLQAAMPYLCKADRPVIESTIAQWCGG